MARNSEFPIPNYFGTNAPTLVVRQWRHNPVKRTNEALQLIETAQKIKNMNLSPLSKPK